MSRPEPKVPQYGPAISWLLAKGVTSDRLATLFGTTPANIRVIAHRSRHGGLESDSVGITSGDQPIRLLAQRHGVRAGLDEVVRTLARTRSLDSLRTTIEETVALRSGQYEFLLGAKEMRQLLPRVGYAGDSRRVALRALIHQHMAWFLVHSGRSISAATEARTARELWRVAHHESPNREYGAQLVKASLIGSQAWLLACRPSVALAELDIAGAAAQSIGDVLGSDHYRQRGSAFLQLRADQDALRHFQSATEMMERLGEARVPAQLLLTGDRHLALINLDVEQSLNVLDVTRRTFGENSLETSMALHWAVATGLSTDSDSIATEALGLLSHYPSPPPQFGHQSTIRKLLLITSELGLDVRLTRAWVRRALYENALRGN